MAGWRKAGIYYHRGELQLQSEPDQIGAVLAQRTLSPNYNAVAVVQQEESGEGKHGLAAIGDPNNALGISVAEGEIEVWKAENGERIEVSSVLSDVPIVYLKMEVGDGQDYEFFWSEDGSSWNAFPNQETLDGYFLPPWDRAVRVGLFSKGPTSSKGVFSKFEVLNL